MHKNKCGWRKKRRKRRRQRSKRNSCAKLVRRECGSKQKPPAATLKEELKKALAELPEIPYLT